MLFSCTRLFLNFCPHTIFIFFFVISMANHGRLSDFSKIFLQLICSWFDTRCVTLYFQAMKRFFPIAFKTSIEVWSCLPLFNYFLAVLSFTINNVFCYRNAPNKLQCQLHTYRLFMENCRNFPLIIQFIKYLSSEMLIR